MRILFVSLTDDMGSDRLVSDMGRAGAACAVLGPSGCVASLPRCVSATFTVPSGFRAAFSLSRGLRRAVSAWKPDRLVPLDDLAATLLRTLGGRRRLPAPMRHLIEASFGTPDHYPAACHRVDLMLAAEAAGVRVPPFRAADWRSAAHDLDAVPMPAMVKRDQSSGSGGVVRTDTLSQLKKAIRQGWVKSALKAQGARLARLGRPVTPVLIQGVVDGRLAMYTAVCRDGQVIDGAGFLAVETHPVKRSSTILRHCPHPEMAESARRVVSALGCSGFVSFDFIIDAAEQAFLIEMNPRPVGSAHLGRNFGHDLAYAFLIGNASHQATGVPDDRDVALFPKELERDPAGRRLDDGLVRHDVPAHEPAVMAAYLQRLQAEHPAHATALARRCGTAATEATSSLPSGVHFEPC